MKTVIYTLLALMAFAGNSLLCRWALAEKSIDPGSFTIIRLVSGAIFLVLLIKIKFLHEAENTSSGNWFAAAALFLYAISFSYAYTLLDTGIGALILFTVVQISLLIHAYWRGEKFSYTKACGSALAFAGLIYLLWPNSNSKLSLSFQGFLLMATSGLAWAVYTIVGQGSKTPLSDSRDNFVKAAFISIPLLLPIFFWGNISSMKGYILAIASGAITSGLGYSLWYAVLPKLSSQQAATLQLSVPVLAAIAGVLVLGEAFTLQLGLAICLIFSGITLVTFSGRKIR